MSKTLTCLSDYFPSALRSCSNETKPLWTTTWWLIMVSTPTPRSSISVIAEMEAEDIKHSEQAGCVEAELSYWIVDLQTGLCNGALNSGLEERKMRHRMIPLKYLSWVFVVLSSVLSFGGALLSSLCHPCASDGSYNHIAPYFLPTEMSVCHIRHKSCTSSWSQRLVKEGSRGGATMPQNSFRVYL